MILFFCVVCDNFTYRANSVLRKEKYNKSDKITLIYGTTGDIRKLYKNICKKLTINIETTGTSF